MQTVQLGKSSLKCSRLGFGCWRIAGNTESGKVSPEAEATGRKAVEAAYECGYTLFDLSDIYGDGACENIFGRALREVSGMRQHILIATKCGIRRKGDPSADSPYRYDFSAEHILRSCEQSLKRLGVEMIDLYQLHRPDFIGNPTEVAEAFGKLKKAGKVREFGVSNFRPSQVTAFQAACSLPLIANQMEISLAKHDAFHDGTLDQCLAETITPMAWSPLAGGRLVDTGPIDLHTPDHAHRIHVRETLDLLARERGVTRTVAAIAWLLKHPARIVPLLGSTNPERIRDAINATEIELTREEWYRLMEAARGQRLP
jgi:predicted oxidoreductase